MMNKTVLAMLMMTACGVEDDARVTRVMSDRSGAAEFEVELRYAGMPEWQANDMLQRIELIAAREQFPGIELPPKSDDRDDEPLDGSEPTFVVSLHPLNDGAAAERFAWSMQNVPAEPRRPADGAVGTIEQGLSIDLQAPIVKVLAPFQTWKGPRHKCYAPYTFAASILGGARVCVDQGYDGNAATRCVVGYDPTNLTVVVHDGIASIWNPRLNDEKWFTGRISAFLPTNIIAWGTICL